MAVVTHPLRRKILTLLIERSELTRLELADLLAADPDLPATDARHLEIALHHNHLPRLTEKSLIEYDPRAGDIIRREEPEVIKSHLDAVTFDE